MGYRVGRVGLVSLALWTISAPALAQSAATLEAQVDAALSQNDDQYFEIGDLRRKTDGHDASLRETSKKQDTQEHGLKALEAKLAALGARMDSAEAELRHQGAQIRLGQDRTEYAVGVAEDGFLLAQDNQSELAELSAAVDAFVYESTAAHDSIAAKIETFGTAVAVNTEGLTAVVSAQRKADANIATNAAAIDAVSLRLDEHIGKEKTVLDELQKKLGQVSARVDDHDTTLDTLAVRDTAVRVFVASPSGTTVATVYPAALIGDARLPDDAYYADFDSLDPLAPKGSGTCFDVYTADFAPVFAFDDLPLSICDGDGAPTQGKAAMDPTEVTMSQLTLHAPHRNQ